MGLLEFVELGAAVAGRGIRVFFEAEDKLLFSDREPTEPALEGRIMAAPARAACFAKAILGLAVAAGAAGEVFSLRTPEGVDALGMLLFSLPAEVPKSGRRESRFTVNWVALEGREDLGKLEGASMFARRFWSISGTRSNYSAL